MTRLGILLIAATMTWQQVTPTDENGCAGFVPKNYDQPNLSPQAEIYRLPDPPPSNTQGSDNGHHHGNNKLDNHQDKGHDYGNNQGHGQFDQPKQGGYKW